MNNVYGVCTESLSTVYTRLKKQKKVKIVTDKLKKADLLLFPSLSIYKRFKTDIPSIIFDSPLALSRVKNIILLDMNKKSDLLDIEFKNRQIKLSKIKPNKCKLKKQTVTQFLLKEKTKTPFITNINACLYYERDISVRRKLKQNLMSYLKTKKGRLVLPSTPFTADVKKHITPEFLKECQSKIPIK